MDPADQNNEIPSETAARLRDAMSGPGLDQITRQRFIEAGAGALATRRRHRTAWRTAGAIAATLALATVATFLIVRAPSPHRMSESVSITLAADINADGVVDILDAHALARAFERGYATPDLDSDGVSSLADADWIAKAVTRLEGASG